MKKVFYESWIAKHLLFKDCTTITLFAWVFTKWSKEEASQSTINHECVHARQWVELSICAAIILWFSILIYNISVLWFLVAPFVFYIWYIVEWFIRELVAGVMADCSDEYNAYRRTSFEREARLAEYDNSYLENSDYFTWFKFLFK